jgi:hypothetical protein
VDNNYLGYRHGRKTTRCVDEGDLSYVFVRLVVLLDDLEPHSCGCSP